MKIINIKTFYFLLVLSLAILFSASSPLVLAQDSVGGKNASADVEGKVTPPATSNIFTLQNPLKVNSLGELIQSFVQIFTYLVILFAVLMFIYIGFQYVVNASQGNAKKIEELHKQLLWLVVGVAVVIGARVLIQVIINTLSATGTVSPDIIQSANNAIGGK